MPVYCSCLNYLLWTCYATMRTEQRISQDYFYWLIHPEGTIIHHQLPKKPWDQEAWSGPLITLHKTFHMESCKYQGSLSMSINNLMLMIVCHFHHYHHHHHISLPVHQDIPGFCICEFVMRWYNHKPLKKGRKRNIVMS